MSSGALQIGSGWRGGNPSFVQQGQVDWVAFGNTIWSASAAVLQRFAAANIQPVTYGAGLVLASQFQLDRLGQWRMEKAVESLRANPIFENLLWVGFGYQSVVRTMGESVAGLKSLALCACLTEVHSEEFSAWVLGELWQVLGFPDEFEPSHIQFLALVKVSAGVVAASEFSTILDTMLGDQIWRRPAESGLGYDNVEISCMEAGILSSSNAKDLANALHGLFKVSKGDAQTIIVTGGSECAFLAGLAYWLFNMRIQVQNSEGQSIFKNDEEKPAQVIIQYGELKTEAIQIAHTTYILEHGGDIFYRIRESEESNLIVRTPWDGCLSRVFGATFRQLSNLPHLLGDYLGGVARIYKAISCGESNASRICRENFFYYVETSYGHGFINTVLSTFPELQRTNGLRDRMQHVMELSFDDAMRITEQSVSALETLCNCPCCEHERTVDDVWLFSRGVRTCIVGLAYTIRKIASGMACAVQDPDGPLLAPAVQGILELSLEGRSPESMAEGLKDEAIMEELEDGATTRFYWNALGLRAEQRSHIHFNYHTLATVSVLFQGSQLGKSGVSLERPKPCTAVSRRGICCFIDAIRSLGCQADMLCRAHIFIGHIHYKNRSYEFIFDGDIPGEKSWTAAEINPAHRISLEKPWPAVEKHPAQIEEAQDSIPDAINTVPDITKVQALATELSSGSALTCYYRVSTSTSAVLISPGGITRWVLGRTGLIICNGYGCKRRLAFPCSIVRGGYQVPETDAPSSLTFSSRLACCVWTYQDEIARCLVMISHWNYGANTRHYVYLRRQECLPCCTASVLRDSSTMVPDADPKARRDRDAVAHII